MRCHSACGSAFSWGGEYRVATKASDLFVQCLENEGCEYIFGVPGEENLRGAIVIEKVVTLPEGSANPTVTSPLVDHDQLARKLGIRISICNRDTQAIFVDETEF